MTNFATVLIPTLGRSNLIKYTLNGLKSQSSNDFEVLLVLRFYDDETIKIAEEYTKYLDIRVLYQKRRGLVEAYNEGIHNARGDVVIFLDDDAIPLSDFVAEHLLTYERIEVSGVSGEVIPAHLVNGAPKPLNDQSEITSLYREPDLIRIIGDKLWNRPLEGLERFLVYITKAGYSKGNIYIKHDRIIKSLLCMGTNMSILASVFKSFTIPTSFLKRGISFEQVIGWHLWKAGHTTVFNPKACVYHIRHGQTMSRLLNPMIKCKAVMEDELVFYYLFDREENLSRIHRVVSLAYRSSVHARKIREDWKFETAVLKGILLGNIVGLKWLVSRMVGGTYSPIHDTLLK
jgi:glycosyltransferase involved in cell wall biosynthesis